jgi:hypothetical protein
MTPDDELTTQQLRDIFAERAEEEAERADEAEETGEVAGFQAHARRSDKAAYLKEKLEEQAEADEDA